ncbi:MAG: calcium-binding protein, partial [Roseovarius sp.]|nr:calcium-binding protein [Roseovarius sp.]
MAHLDSNFTSFGTFLQSAEAVYRVDLAALNSSGVTGNALVALGPEEEDGAQYVNVAISVDGMEADQPVPQHIHGLFDGDGNPIDSTTPDINNDADRDGMVEVLEGVASYGDVLLTLAAEDGNPPMTNSDGSFTYIRSFDVNDDSNFGSPVTMTDYQGDDILPLTLREIVLHGVSVPADTGDGTGGEVDGTQDGFVPILPAAAGEIEQTTLTDALDLLEDMAARSGETVMLGDGGESYMGSGADDMVTGGDGDDAITGEGGGDDLSGGAGSDDIDGDLGDDMISAGAGDMNAENGADDGAS